MQDLPEGQTHHYEDDCNPPHQRPESDWRDEIESFFNENFIEEEDHIKSFFIYLISRTIASERKMAYQEGLAEWYIDESDGDLITLAEAITIDYANLSGRESANRAEFRERTLQRLQIYFNQLPILDTRNLELQNKRLLENNDILTKKIRAAKREAYEEAIGLSDKIELHYETEFNEWRAFKRFRNELRDRLASQQEPKD